MISELGLGFFNYRGHKEGAKHAKMHRAVSREFRGLSNHQLVSICEVSIINTRKARTKKPDCISRAFLFSDMRNLVYKVPLLSCSRSMASNKAWKFPFPKLQAPLR